MAALALALSAFALVRVVTGQGVPDADMPLAETRSVPAADVPGAELAGLPRYPGSVRVEYDHAVASGLATTRVRYVAPAELEAVREFYRQVFRTEGWSEVDVRFTPGTWRFLVVSGRREARIRIESRGTLVDIEIGLSQPISAGARG